MLNRFLKNFPKVALCALTLVIIAASAQAADRTTPVTVNNTPTVTVTNTPNVAVTNTPSVTVTGTPNVAVTNTPNVAVTNSPTVKIDSVNNVVQTVTKNNIIQLFGTDRSLPNGTSTNSQPFDCTGYKEIRVVLFSNSSSANLNAWAGFGTSFNGSYKFLGIANFSTPAITVANQGNFVALAPNTSCYFSHPVISNSACVYISNNSGGTVTLSKESWVYLVN
jgi:hypothetical protein